MPRLFRRLDDDTASARDIVGAAARGIGHDAADGLLGPRGLGDREPARHAARGAEKILSIYWNFSYRAFTKSTPSNSKKELTMNDPVIREEVSVEDEALMELALRPDTFQDLDSLFKVSAVDTLAFPDTRRC